MAEAPLSGLVVADFSRILSGPLVTMTLADLGASVIKVERPEAGDDTRAWGPPFEEGESAYFRSVNRGKRSIALDLKDAEDLRLAEALCERAGVVVENFRPGTMERIGLGYERVAERNPGVVYCSISGFGPGAGASLPGYDLLLQAAGGLMSITGAAEGEPTKVGVAVIDVIAGLYATVGVLGALRARERSGEGAHVEVDLLSAELAALVNQAAGFLMTGQAPHPLGTGHPNIVPYDVFRTGSDPIVIAVGNDRQFARLCEALEAPELASDPRFETNERRVEHREELRALLEERLAARPAEHWLVAVGDREIPCGPINDVAAAIGLAERLGLDPVTRLERDGAQAVPAIRSPLAIGGERRTDPLPPPRLDEHGEELRAWLGGEAEPEPSRDGGGRI